MTYKRLSKSIVILILIVFFQNGYSQDRLKVFIDCSNTRCDLDYFRTEINIVDFLLDRIAADVHVLITSQRTGSGGRNYQMIFYGQNELSETKHTLEFNTSMNATDFERRDELLRHLKLGLIPLLVELKSTEDINITMKSEQMDGQPSMEDKLNDPWNFWVFRIGADGSFDADQNYKALEYNGEISANRTTDDMKFVMEAEYGEENSTFSYTEDGEEVEVKVNNNSFDFSHLLAFSISDHWSYGYIARVSSSTFSNNKNRIFLQPSIEYSFFPYNQVNNRYWTLRYGVDFRRNVYYETSIFNKEEESLWGHGLEMNVQFNKKWGNISGGIDAHTYFHDWELFNFGLFYRVDIRVTGGLFIYTRLYAGLIQDQIYLPRGEASEQEVLTRQRQLQSSYSFWTNFGINYRFGSDLNNFVNPRFR